VGQESPSVCPRRALYASPPLAAETRVVCEWVRSSARHIERQRHSNTSMTLCRYGSGCRLRPKPGRLKVIHILRQAPAKRPRRT
jgi:hypothetical protein